MTEGEKKLYHIVLLIMFYICLGYWVHFFFPFIALFKVYMVIITFQVVGEFIKEVIKGK